MTREEALKSFEEENKDFEKIFERYGYQMSPEEVSAVKEALERNKVAISALSENKWIPVSERLPEESGRYLTYIVNEYDKKLQYIMTADYISRPTPIEGLSPWNVDDECASDNVVAWQPLPEPYKAESEDKAE